MTRFILASTCLLALTITATAAPTLQRVRGTIESSDKGTVTVKTSDGKSVVLQVADETKYVSVGPSSLDAVKDGVFIGTATKGENPPVALEVVLFPDSMKGTGEGHYDWDSITDTTEGGAKPVAGSMMKNGTVSAKTKPMTKSAMTNGTIKSGSAADGAKKITVTYDNGKSIDITVPPTAPIVAFAPADMTIVKAGGNIFVVAAEDGTKLDAKLVAVGKDGVVPPM